MTGREMFEKLGYEFIDCKESIQQQMKELGWI